MRTNLLQLNTIEVIRTFTMCNWIRKIFRKRKMKLSITERPENRGETSELRTEVLSRLTEDELFSPTKEELCYHTLKHFAFTELDLNDTASIEAACSHIVELIGMKSDALASIGLKDETRLQDPMNRYMHYFLLLDMVPGEEKLRLESLVRQDLATVESWIVDYESNYQFIANGDIPRNHDQRTIKDFYDRCLEERNTIQNYLDYGLAKRAREKAGLTVSGLWDITRDMMSQFLDRPYRLPIPRSTQYFKHDSINQVNHRVGPLPIQEAERLRGLYETDKAQFYQQLESKLSPDKIMSYLNNSIKWLPKINPDRVNVFQELEELYKSKKYWGFYSLAIPQVEGLFTDMGKLCIPNYNHSQSALPDKVQVIRPLSQNHEYELDYFQYRLPNMRNSYLHYGSVDSSKLELLCKEILFDLFGVIEIFNTLNSDPIWLNLLVKKQDIAEFSTAQNFSFYFKLKDNVKRIGHAGLYQDEIDQMNKSFFPDIILGISMELGSSLDNLKRDITEITKSGTKNKGWEIDLSSISHQELADNKEQVKNVISDIFNNQIDSEIREAKEIKSFLQRYKTNLEVANIDSSAIASLDNIETTYSDFLGKVMQICQIIEFKK